MSRTLRRLCFGHGPNANLYSHCYHPSDLLKRPLDDHVHKEIYRNGSSFRQRRKAIAMTKRLDHSTERQRLKEELRNIWLEY